MTEGHNPDIEATGRGDYLRAVLWCSFLCPMMLSPILFFWALDYLKENSSGEEDCVFCSTNETNQNTTCLLCCKFYFCHKKEKPLIRSVTYLCCFLLLIEVVIVCAVVLSSSENSTKGNFPSEFYAIIAVIGLDCFYICRILQCCAYCAYYAFCSRLLLIVCTNLLLYHLCWVAIGIMINPTWGLSVLLIISYSFVSLFYAINQISFSCIGHLLAKLNIL